MLEGLLSNGMSSLYMPAMPAQLEKLERIIAALEGRELFDRSAMDAGADQGDVR